MKERKMGENSPVISVQRTEDSSSWTISREDLSRRAMEVIHTSTRLFPTYEVAIADAESVLRLSTVS
jgi:hypothetical protein